MNLLPDTHILMWAALDPDRHLEVPDQPPDPSRNDLIPNGEVRSVYAAVPPAPSGPGYAPPER